MRAVTRHWVCLDRSFTQPIYADLFDAEDGAGIVNNERRL